VAEEPRNYRDTTTQDIDLAGRFYQACLERGVYFHHVSPHHGFTSAHTMADVEETLSVVEDAARAVAGR
jgi:glutamate-1-semialdehyde aminotransferase